MKEFIDNTIRDTNPREVINTNKLENLVNLYTCTENASMKFRYEEKLITEAVVLIKTYFSIYENIVGVFSNNVVKPEDNPAFLKNVLNIQQGLADIEKHLNRVDKSYFSYICSEI